MVVYEVLVRIQRKHYIGFYRASFADSMQRVQCKLTPTYMGFLYLTSGAACMALHTHQNDFQDGRVEIAAALNEMISLQILRLTI